MAKPLVFTIKNSAGTFLSAKEIINGAIKVIKENDIISEMTRGPQAKAILEDGQIARYRYFKDFFIGDQAESVIYSALKSGASVTAQDWVKNEINIDLDDSRTTIPKIIRSQDLQALDETFANNSNLMLNTMTRRREVRWFEEVRLKVKSFAAISDGITRVVDTTSVTTDEAYTRLVQSSISSLIDFFDDIFTKDTVDALGIGPDLLVGSFKHNILTKMSNTQAFTGASKSTEQLEKGTLGILSQVELKHQGWKNGIDGVIMVRGAVMMPIGNIQRVDDQVGNFTKQWLRWDMPKQGSSDALFSYIIMFGDPAVINA